jgi:hypothetical protein
MLTNQKNNIMIRITKMSGVFYGVELSSDYKEEFEQINDLASEGNPSIIVDTLEDFQDLGLGFQSDVKMIERD